jgi:uncharacterized protein YndB with AHSA1/START domain
MIRRLAGLAIIGGSAAAAADRWLAARAGRAEPQPIESTITVGAPIERTWEVVSDVESQPRWMHEMKSVRLLTPPPVGVGTRGVATVRVLGIQVRDPVTFTEWEPPHRFSIRHEGAFTGGGTITLESVDDGLATLVRWAENPIPPLFPHLGALAQRPVLSAIFQADLERLKRLVEQEG